MYGNAGMLIMSNMAPGSLEQYTTYVKKAEERGLRNFLVTESFTDSLALAQHLASVTSKIQVGTGITNLYLRNPLIAALHAMTVDRLAPGRLLLGLGTSHVPLKQHVRDRYGKTADRPAGICAGRAEYF